jgi:hypothetical protein
MWGFTWSSDEEDPYELVMTDICTRPSLDDLWIGVKPETLVLFAGWLQAIEPEYYATLDMAAAYRYNQGDAFIANSMDVTTPTSPVGSAEGPIIGDVINQMTSSDEE